jgi:peptidoglycan/xylan/chitin deacetylase (PgdA/CDA1 family)
MDFERIIVRLKEMGEFVRTDELISMLSGERPVDGRYFHLSFDDGFRNNYTNAVPILKKHEVPAIFFVPSGFIGADWERTRAYCLDVANYGSVVETLRWDDLKEMLDAGYEIGSHTRTHCRFTAISDDPARLEKEILGSKEELEAGLGYRCRYISWPYGRATDADAASVRFTKTAGYDACFGAFRGSIVVGQTDRYRIPRHHFESQWPLSHVEYFARGNRETVD